jgi:small-conductance mechanosensitive channel
MNYPMYGNNQYYLQDLQQMRDRIDQQMRQMQQPIQQQPTAINQTFQISPQNQNLDNLEAKIVKDIEEVKNTLVMKTGVFVNKDYSSLWIKDVTGSIRTFSTSEIIELDEKDKEIAEKNKEINELKQQMEQMKLMVSMATTPTETKATESKTTNKSK